MRLLSYMMIWWSGMARQSIDWRTGLPFGATSFYMCVTVEALNPCTYPAKISSWTSMYSSSSIANVGATGALATIRSASSASYACRACSQRTSRPWTISTFPTPWKR
ncbi:hypothetical protein CPB85DRAFT_183886 [Mucidula mucida]|nr:hypothetical protein CPB85DRAFT_183886 [Mucidula mucida]